MTVEQIARQTQVSRNTVRARLGSIFAKTFTHRQAGLVLPPSAVSDETGRKGPADELSASPRARR